MARAEARIERALESIGFRRAHYGITVKRGRYSIEVISGGARWTTDVLTLTTDERLEDYLRRKLPCPTGRFSAIA